MTVRPFVNRPTGIEPLSRGIVGQQPTPIRVRPRSTGIGCLTPVGNSGFARAAWQNDPVHRPEKRGRITGLGLDRGAVRNWRWRRELHQTPAPALGNPGHAGIGQHRQTLHNLGGRQAQPRATQTPQQLIVGKAGWRQLQQAGDCVGIHERIEPARYNPGSESYLSCVKFETPTMAAPEYDCMRPSKNPASSPRPMARISSRT